MTKILQDTMREIPVKIVKEFEKSNFADIYQVKTADGAPAILKISRSAKPEFNEIIAREYSILSQVRHPNIVRVFDFDVDPQGRAYFTAEFKPGKPFNVSFRGYSEEFADVVLQMLNALSVLHNRGLIHTDLKPEHIIYDPGTKHATLIDFGFAGQVAEGLPPAGTIGYVAPEVTKGTGPDQRSDLYSLGVIIYETLAGRKPGTAYEPVKDVPRELNELLRRMTAREPYLRPSMPEIIDYFLKKHRAGKRAAPDYRVSVPHSGYVEPETLAAMLKLPLVKPLILAGDTGSGKTRNLKEIKYRLQTDGYRVVFHAGFSRMGLLDALAASLNIADLPLEKDNKLQVFEEIRQAIVNRTDPAKLAVVVDDLGSMSGFDLDLFRYVGIGSVSGNFALLGSVSNSIPAVLEFCRRQGFDILPLEPFSGDHIRMLVEKTFSEITALPESKDLAGFVRWISGISGGNPLFVVETLEALHAASVLAFKKNRWYVDLGALETFKPPEKLDNFFSEKIKKVPGPEFDILKIMAVCDSAVKPALITAMMPQHGAIGLEHLTGLGLLKCEPIDNDCNFVISNPVVKALVKKTIDNREAGKVADLIIGTLEKTPPVDRIFLPVLARLSEERNRPESAAGYLKSLIDQTTRVFDFESSLAYYERRLAIDKSIDSAEFCRDSLKAADLCQTIGANDQARTLYKQALQSPDEPIKANALAGMAKLEFTSGNRQAALELIENGVQLIDKKATDRIRLLNFKAYVQLNAGDHAGARNTLNDSLIIAGKSGHPDLQAESDYYDAVNEWYANDHTLGLEKAKNLYRFCKENSLDKQAAFAANLIASFLLQLGDLKNAENYANIALDIFGRIKQVEAYASTLVNRANIRYTKSDQNDAKKDYSEALEFGILGSNAEVLKHCWRGLSMINRNQGQLNVALECAEKALAIDKTDATARLDYALVNYLRGDLARLKTTLEKDVSQTSHPFELIMLANLHCQINDEQTALERTGQALDRIENQGYSGTVKTFVLVEAAKIMHILEPDGTQAITLTERALALLSNQSIEYIITSMLHEIFLVHLKRADSIDFASKLKILKDKGFLLDYASLTLKRLDILLDRDINQVLIPAAVADLLAIEHIYATIGVTVERPFIDRLKLKLFPLASRLITNPEVPVNYLSTLTEIADLISNGIEQPRFEDRILDLIMKATGAERAAFFRKSRKGMEFVCGRNIDRLTLKDAGALSKTSIDDISRHRHIFVRDAAGDASFSMKKSVILNKIRSILCLPLVAGGEVVGAVYLDSRSPDNNFDEYDKNYIETVSKILGSVLEKSSRFQALAGENVLLKSRIIGDIGPDYLVGDSRPIKKIHREIETIGRSNAPVLLLGETGTGKGMIARLIHKASRRNDKKFLTINCGTIPGTLLESELFGHKKGSFTDAKADKPGLLEEAQAGSIFLDEITNTTLDFQSRLLEAIEDKVIRRIGETAIRKIDVRFILATNRDIEIEVEENRFRKDLYYRINVFTLKVPSLRERVQDIPLLARFFLEQFSKDANKKISGFTADAVKLLRSHNWPGNIRELKNTIERIVITTDHAVITGRDIGFTMAQAAPANIAAIRDDAIIDALHQTQGSVQKAAKILGINRRTIQRFLKANPRIRREVSETPGT